MSNERHGVSKHRQLDCLSNSWFSLKSRETVSALPVPSRSESRILFFTNDKAHNRQEPWWRHQIETFSALLALCAGNSPVTGAFPSQRPVTRSFDVLFHLCLTNGWLNNRRCVHYDVTVMYWINQNCLRLIARETYSQSCVAFQPSLFLLMTWSRHGVEHLQAQ